VLRQRPHAGDGCGLARRCAEESLVVGDCDIALRGTIAVQLPVDAHGLVSASLFGELTGPWRSWSPSVFELLSASDSGDIGIVGIRPAQAVQCLVGFVSVAHQLVVLCQTGQGFRIVGFGEEICCQS